MLKSLMIAVTLLTSTLAHANDNVTREFDPAYMISHVEVTPLETAEKGNTVTLPSAPGAGIGLGEVAMIIDGLLAIGKKVWPIIDANRPVITTTGLAPALSVLPQFDVNARNVELHQMAGWSHPKAASYRVSYKNIYGGELVGFTYTVYFQFNGSHNGVGKYLTSVTVQASQVSAAWSMNFDAQSELVSVANVGTSMEPVASAIIRISYKVRSLFNEMRDAQSFYVDGLGNLKLLNP